jgi:hypothetical protein
LAWSMSLCPWRRLPRQLNINCKHGSKFLVSGIIIVHYFNVNLVFFSADFARQITKDQLRSPIIQKLVKCQDEDIDNFVRFITKSAIQKSLEMYLEMLKQKKKK